MVFVEHNFTKFVVIREMQSFFHIPTFRGGRGAMFWYNPVRGIVRARVPDQTTDESTLSLYEQVNGESWEN